MSETAFTPGPWKAIEGVSPIYNQLIGISASDEGHVGVVSTYHTAKPSQWKANARLIAAAPEMYEALQATLAILEGPTPPAAEMFATMDRARAALAKAEAA